LYRLGEGGNALTVFAGSDYARRTERETREASTMTTQKLTIRSADIRPVSLPLKRPVVSKVGRYEQWPLILIDLQTEEGPVGRSYLEPYLRHAARYIVPALHDLVAAFTGTSIGPFDFFETARKSLTLVGLEGMSLIAVSGIDMALWDARARAAEVPLAVYLGGSLGPVPAYNSNGLWLTPLDRLGQEAGELVAEGGFTGLKLRLGRERIEDDVLAIRAVREAVGDQIKLMVDFNQGLTLGEALQRCHGLDDQGLYWFEEPIAYDNLQGYARLTRELRTPIQLGENFWGPRSLYQALQAEACDLVMPDLMRIGGVTGWLRATAIAGSAGIPMSSHLYPETVAHLMRVTETAHWLEWQDWANPILAAPFELKNGHLIVPDRPGNGLAWNDDVVKRYRYDV
jgi:mandelate racemase